MRSNGFSSQSGSPGHRAEAAVLIRKDDHSNYTTGKTVLVQFQPEARFRSEGPEVSSPVREDGELHLLIARKARRAGTNRGAPSVLR